MPTVSIIVPAYNAEKSIRHCIQSILDQTYTDFELLAMDDGSTDTTPQILDELAAKDARIRVIHKKNSGVSDTRNQALNLARGKYIQFLDADDWIAGMTTELYVHTMEDHPTCDMVISDFYRVVGEKRAQKGDISEEGLLSREEYAKHLIRNPADFYYGVLWNKFYRRSIIERFGIRMDSQLSWSEDFIFNMEYVLHVNQIFVLRYPTYYYVKTEGSLVETQGTGFAKTVQTKLAIVEYYSNFYKDVYKDGGYYRRVPAIYSYLLNFARDGNVNPIVNDGSLQNNPVDITVDPAVMDNPFVFYHYEAEFLKEMARRLVDGYDLDVRDAAVLLYLKLAGTAVSMTSIRNFTGLSQSAATASLQKLTRREYVEKIKAKRPAPALYTFGSESGQIQEALEHILRDAQDIQLRGLTPEERQTFLSTSRKIMNNIRTALGGEA